MTTKVLKLVWKNNFDEEAFVSSKINTRVEVVSVHTYLKEVMSDCGLKIDSSWGLIFTLSISSAGENRTGGLAKSLIE